MRRNGKYVSAYSKRLSTSFFSCRSVNGVTPVVVQNIVVMLGIGWIARIVESIQSIKKEIEVKLYVSH